MVWFSLLSILLFCFLSNIIPTSNSLSSPNENQLCHPTESSALLSFKNSFTSVFDNSYYLYCHNEFKNVAKPNSTVSWEIGGDCCGWSGVTCDEATGFVIGLHLTCGRLWGDIDSNNSLFSLTHIQILDLSYNSIDGPISPNFGRFGGMVKLDLSSCEFTGQVPFELAYLSNLKTLDLGWNSIGLWLETHIFKQIIANLTNLEVLKLGYTDMSGVFPSSFTNLSTSLTSLDLGDTWLLGEFPEYIFRLPNLDELDLGLNSLLTGLFPKYNWTSSLRSLDLSNNYKLMIDFPNIKHNFKYLKELFVGHCELPEKLPAILDNIRQITSLGMGSNNFRGPIPWEFLNLENLTYLDLSENNFTGVLPEICKNISKSLYLCDPLKNQIIGPLPLKLKSLKLSHNLLNGTIPSWLYFLPLRELVLSHNHFSGQINEFQFNSLEALYLGSNKLHGLIPRSIFRQVNLSWLHLSSNNLSGVVKLEQFSKFKNLHELSPSYNSLSIVSTGQTNHTLPNLWYLDLDSCNMSEFPYSLRSSDKLRSLNLSNNRIGGTVPELWFMNVGKSFLYDLDLSHNILTNMCPILWQNLIFIDLRSNQLHGHLPIPQVSTIEILASNNQFNGEISSLICNISGIQVLDLANNSLSGNIPPCIGNLSSLVVLDLRMNKFDGTLPSFMPENSLATLNVNGNRLEGMLSEPLVNCQNLEVLDVGNNKLTGHFPQWLELLPKLQVLILRSNRFHGVITDSKVRFPFQELRVLDLSNNEFTGLLPTKYFENFVAMMGAHTNVLEYMEKDDPGWRIYYQDSINFMIKGHIIAMEKILKTFIAIDLSANNFTGEIPDFIEKLKSLNGLNLSHNSLTGVIPARLGNLSNLECLDLSSNKLVGSIPWQFAAYLNQLQILNLSSNRLEGPIPRGSQFDTFNSKSYTGNLGLCGFPLSQSCTEDSVPKEEGIDDEEEPVEHEIMLNLKAVMMGYASGLVIGISLGYIVFFSRRFDYWLMERFGERLLRINKANARRMRRRRRSN